MSVIGAESVSLVPGFWDLVHANYEHIGAAMMNSSLKAADSCSEADNTALVQQSTTTNCYFSTLPTVSQLNTCLSNAGVSGSCRSCLIEVVSDMINCLNTCGYNGNTMTNAQNADCITCLIGIASDMQDSPHLLGGCGITPNVSSVLIGQFDPITTTTTKSGTLRYPAKIKAMISLLFLYLIFM